MLPCCWWGVEAEAAVAMVARVQMGEVAAGYPGEEAVGASYPLEETADMRRYHDHHFVGQHTEV